MLRTKVSICACSFHDKSDPIQSYTGVYLQSDPITIRPIGGDRYKHFY